MTFLEAMDEFLDASEVHDIAQAQWTAAWKAGDVEGMQQWDAVAKHALADMHAAEQAMRA